MKRIIAFLIVAIGFSQTADEIARHKEWMDRAQELKDDLKDALDSKAGKKAVQYADELAKTGAQEEAYWKRAKQEDTVKLAKENLDAAKQISVAAKDGDIGQALQAYSKLEATCRGCHDLHPEKRRTQRQ